MLNLGKPARLGVCTPFMPFIQDVMAALVGSQGHSAVCLPGIRGFGPECGALKHPFQIDAS
jgi:hypothetical protein